MKSFFNIPDESRFFITDEDGLGYPNFYWRFVRSGRSSDVGSVHADRWFWDIRNQQVPEGFERVKLWMPLKQNDDMPSLMIYPGSHLKNFDYEISRSTDGRHRPVFSDRRIIESMVPAPVASGQAIVFNDRLLHGGRATDLCRVSVELTMAVD